MGRRTEPQGPVSSDRSYQAQKERRVKVGLAGGEGAGKRAGGTLPEEGRHFGGAGRLPEAGTWRAGGH